MFSGIVKGHLAGDETGGNKKAVNDSIFVAGRVLGKIYGDNIVRNGFAGSDTIQISPSSVIGKGIIGDNSNGKGGNDNIKVNGKINDGGVIGDGSNGNGGNDTISIFSLADVTGSVYGDDANMGGADVIYVVGKVNGSVRGDKVNGRGGNDDIYGF